MDGINGIAGITGIVAFALLGTYGVSTAQPSNLVDLCFAKLQAETTIEGRDQRAEVGDQENNRKAISRAKTQRRKEGHKRNSYKPQISS